MNPTVLIAVLTPLAAIVGAGLTYLATRKRDAPQLELDHRRLELDASNAALQAWPEIVAQVRIDLLSARDDAAEVRRSMRVLEGRFVLLRVERDDYKEQVEKMTRQLVSMEGRVESLTGLLDTCLAQLPEDDRA